ncbi:GTP cyclohydrolase I FolE [Acinetobacter rudis]|uniref:GTP cyclohydrolase 1 n=1 Tax=Acinetobacter rudis TaxID=632955 RepID=A0AAW8J968_9GAMM|nr:GTP cyclohydrolase I FolE [Acinetobacter rudis]MDQ8936037.1 GTP cyclohydrolase I FolE [Acinetobacter rudis]MDQ9018300.1 GTP cyclohydrolase I FolE [Acinetobacter rudis]
MKKIIEQSEFHSILTTLAEHLKAKWPSTSIAIYPIHSRLAAVIQMLLLMNCKVVVATNIEQADVILSFQENQAEPNGLTIKLAELHQLPVIALDVSESSLLPWESTSDSFVELVAPVISNLLEVIADDPEREGLADTPLRVAKAWKTWISGYQQDPAEILKVFEDGAEGCDEMVIVKDIPIYSKCEHHLADIFGTATIAYIPDGRVVGLSKLSRLADLYARRLQVQERMTNQIADALATHLGAKGVAVLIRARHMCMESRGLCQQGHHTVTIAVRGVLLTDLKARAEFMHLANSLTTA